MEPMVATVISCVVSGLALLVSIYTYRTGRQFNLLQRAHKLLDRLYEFDWLTIREPELQRFVSEQARRETPYFTGDTPRDDHYYKVKAYVDAWLNYFDEILHLGLNDRLLSSVMESESWTPYIIGKMRNSLFKELYRRRRETWGVKFDKFFRQHEAEIERKLTPEEADRF